MSFDSPDQSKSTREGIHSACVGLGSNDRPEKHLPLALSALRSAMDVRSASKAWQSRAVGLEAPDFVNAALVLRTGLDREELMALLKRIEAGLDRDRTIRPELVTIDLDLLVYDDRILRDDLWDLAYRAATVAEVLPDLVRPGTGERLSHASARLAHAGAIWPRTDIQLDASVARGARADASGLT